MGCSWQEHWSGLPFPPQADLPNPGIEPASPKSPALAGGFFTTSTTWEALSGAWASVLLLSPLRWATKGINPSSSGGFGWLLIPKDAHPSRACAGLAEAFPGSYSLCSLTSFSYSHHQDLPPPQTSHTLVNGIFGVPSTWKPCPVPPPLPTIFPWHTPTLGELPMLHPRVGWRPPVPMGLPVRVCYSLLKEIVKFYLSCLDFKPSVDLLHWHERHIQHVRDGVWCAWLCSLLAGNWVST